MFQIEVFFTDYLEVDETLYEEKKHILQDILIDSPNMSLIDIFDEFINFFLYVDNEDLANKTTDMMKEQINL